MTAKRIDGKAAALAIRERVAGDVAEFEPRPAAPRASRPCWSARIRASAVYVRSKNQGDGRSRHGQLRAQPSRRRPARTSCCSSSLELNADERVDGILVQLPLPDADRRPRASSRTIDPAKDVDGFHAMNAGRLAIGLDAFVPCTPLGCLILLQQELGDLVGLDAVVVGRSNIVGKPMAQLLLGEHAR